ncbi:hypothetical protein GCM10023063_16330 [Arthrobacter methylotrophus]|uniref:Lipoprotein n=1 Tax=Arthrobacter methylotrophus TaxID=121291 RepID=A0ABV5UNF9_9MICC
MKTIRALSLAAVALTALLMAGCHSGERPTAPTPAPSSSTSSSDDTTGELVPKIGLNGKLGVGIDMGGGLTMSPSGNLGIGLGL